MQLLLAYSQMGLAVVVWLVALWGVANGWEPFGAWLYHFAWWPLILFLDGALASLTGASLLWRRSREFLRLAVWSVTIWLVFEAFNLVLQNWRYAGLEPRLGVRWPGYALAFATVLPAMFLLAQVLAALGFFTQRRGRPWEPPHWEFWSLLLGTALLIWPLITPRYAFAGLWLGFIFLLDPINELLGGKSLLRAWLAGERQEHFCLMTAGLLCGFWWEMWNYPALARWVYTLPILNFGKIFEMPVLGYLGFAPFALEAAVMYAFLALVNQRLSCRGRRWLFVGQALFWVAMFAALDVWTVRAWR